MFVKIAFLVVFVAITIAVGFVFRKRAGDVNSFVLGGRGVGPWLTAFAYGTSYFSAVVFVGYAGQFGWRFGVAATWIGIGNAVIGSFLPWVILGRRTRVMTHHLGAKTMPEFFGERYGSLALKIGASVVAFVFLIPYTASLYNGLSRLFVVAFGADSQSGFIVCVVVMAVLTGIYVVLGGYVATAVNDFIQGVIMLAGIIAIVGSVLSVNGGFLNSLASLAAVPADAGQSGLAAAPGVFASFFGPDPVGLAGVVILTSLGTWGLPQMVAKFYSIKSENDIAKGTIISTVFAFVVAGGCYFLGGFGRLFSGVAEINEKGVVYDSIIPNMLSGFPDVLMAVIIVLVLSASISTLSSLVITSASTFTIDFLKGNFVKKMTDKSQLLIIRALIVVFIAISSVIAVIQYKGGFGFIAQLMGVSWGALAGAFLAPFLYGLYWKRVTKPAVWASFIFSAALMTLNVFFQPSFPAIIRSPINAGAFAMLAGLVIVPVVSRLTPKPDAARTDAAFACYGKIVTADAAHVLKENGG
ncbi:MAG: sodium:solute symporter [Clostridiales bacterium]|jgi:SSS family solute:Na+ symporter|nr:sodium:solute symporter [Clostridiales bacterium]